MRIRNLRYQIICCKYRLQDLICINFMKIFGYKSFGREIPCQEKWIKIFRFGNFKRMDREEWYDPNIPKLINKNKEILYGMGAFYWKYLKEEE